MTRTLIAVVLFASTWSSQACFAPRGGPAYDLLVTLERMKEANRYRVTVPRRVERDLENAQIMLAYSKHGAGGVPVYDPVVELVPTLNGANFVAEFDVENRGEMKPYIVVMWWHKMSGMCGIQANTEYIHVE